MFPSLSDPGQALAGAFLVDHTRRLSGARVKIKTDEIASIIKRKSRSTRPTSRSPKSDASLRSATVSPVSMASPTRWPANSSSSRPTMAPSWAVMNLETDTVGTVIYGDPLSVKEGDIVKSTGKCCRCPSVRPCSAAWSTRSAARSTAGPRSTPARADWSTSSPRHRRASARDRAAADRYQGHRRDDPDRSRPAWLIIGDRKTGKTAVAVDAIINQKQYWGTEEAVVCIYVAVGQKESTVAGVVETLKQNGAMDYTIVVTAGARTPPRCSTSRYSGCAMGEYFMWSGKEAGKLMSDASPCPSTPCSCTTTSASRPWPTASSRSCSADRPVVRPTG